LSMILSEIFLALFLQNFLTVSGERVNYDLTEICRKLVRKLVVAILGVYGDK